jgi:carbon-monoxide dehydrogenase small subunit
VSKKVHVTAKINGRETEFLCEPRQSLLEVLRDELRLTGTKEGCNNGNCGACNVLLDGKLVNSCLVLGVEVQGKEVETVEGLASPEGLHPLQRMFLENAALQCGICTPGFIIAAKALLDRHPRPSEQLVRQWLAGNLCRCTGYDKIVRAVLDAAVVCHPPVEKPKRARKPKAEKSSGDSSSSETAAEPQESNAPVSAGSEASGQSG